MSTKYLILDTACMKILFKKLRLGKINYNLEGDALQKWNGVISKLHDEII